LEGLRFREGAPRRIFGILDRSPTHIGKMEPEEDEDSLRPIAQLARQGKVLLSNGRVDITIRLAQLAEEVFDGFEERKRPLHEERRLHAVDPQHLGILEQVLAAIRARAMVASTNKNLIVPSILSPCLLEEKRFSIEVLVQGDEATTNALVN